MNRINFVDPPHDIDSFEVGNGHVRVYIEMESGITQEVFMTNNAIEQIHAEIQKAKGEK